MDGRVEFYLDDTTLVWGGSLIDLANCLGHWDPTKPSRTDFAPLEQGKARPLPLSGDPGLSGGPRQEILGAILAKCLRGSRYSNRRADSLSNAAPGERKARNRGLGRGFGRSGDLACE